MNDYKERCEICKNAYAQSQFCDGCKRLHGHGAIHWFEGSHSLFYVCLKCAQKNYQGWKSDRAKVEQIITGFVKAANKMGL